MARGASRAAGLAMVLGVVLAGCVAPGSPEPAGPPSPLPWRDAPPPSFAPRDADAAWPRGTHPWPQGDEWPPGLEGPFAALAPERVGIVMDDGVQLAGWLWRPSVPDGVRVPVVLVSTPYPLDAAWGDQGSIPRVRLVEEGYAVLAVRVRGTGESGGCLDWGGAREQRDQVALVEWAAARPWSNGRVGMMGVSYLAQTAMEAAVAAPPALKTVVIAGIASDLYTFMHTRQAAAFEGGARFLAGFAARASAEPPLGPGLQGTVERACAGLVKPSEVVAVGLATDHRDPAFWGPRDYAARLGDVTAAVLLGHGFQDLWGSGHAAQEDGVWPLLRAPAWQLEGQWGHSFPGGDPRDPEGPRLADWEARLLGWLGFWLKGQGAPPLRLGWVDYEDSAGRWRASRAWPPSEAVVERWPLAAGRLGGAEGSPEASFTARKVEAWPDAVVCGDAKAAGALFVSLPTGEERVVSGNPSVALRLASDAAGGIVSADLFALGPDAGCEAEAWVGAERIAAGSADLRFVRDRHRGRDFPVGEPTEVRIELTNLAHVLPAGHRLAVLVSHSDGSRGGQPFEPTLRLEAGSALLLPLLPAQKGS